MTSIESPRNVHSEADLAQALDAIEAASTLAVDTEFMRVDTYYPRFCLLQIATPDAVYCIDPLAPLDLHGFGARLASTRQPKIMHAARQDLEVLAAIGAGAPQPLVDTQLAAALLGLSDQISYAAIVEQYCGVVIDKTQTRTDWAQRPLTAEQLRYAALDVAYLLPVWTALEAELAAQGKLEWLQEEVDRLLAVHDDTPSPWQRLKGLSQLDGRGQAVARALAEWREAVARAADRPRTWILRDEVIFSLARRRPARLAELAEVQGLPAGTVRRHGELLLQTVNAPDLVVTDAAPNRPVRLSPAGTRLLGELQQRVRERAEAAKVAPTLVAARRELEQLIYGEGTPRFVSGWRAALVGDELLALRAGHAGEELCMPV